MVVRGKWVSVLAAALLGACGGGGDDKHKLYGTTYGNSQLVELDVETGALVKTIGPVGYKINGLEWDAQRQRLLGTVSTGDTNFPNGLVEIDTSTGAGTPIGTGFGMTTVMNPAFAPNGTLYAWCEEGDDPVTIDPVTGVATALGESDLDTWEHSVAFDDAGTLYFINGDGDVFTIDTTTGAATDTGSTIDARAHHGEFHPTTGMFWGIDETNDSGTATRNIRVVDPETWTIVDELPTADNLMAIAFR